MTITHPCTRTHDFKPNSLRRDAEALKNRLYFSSYQTRGMAFAPLACISFGQQAPELLRYQWIVADRAAQRVVSSPDFSLPAAADLPGVVDEHASLLQLYQRRRQRFFRQSVQEALVATFEGVCERVFGSTFALQSYPEYLEFFRRCAVPWVPDFFHAPIDQGSPFGGIWPTSGCWPCLQVSWGRASCVASSFPWPTLPGGGGGDSHSLWQVFHCSPPPPALQGPVHRSRSVPPTAYLGGGFRLFTSGGARAPRPDGGVRPGRSLDSTSYPLGRERSLCATLGFLCPREPLS